MTQHDDIAASPRFTDAKARPRGHRLLVGVVLGLVGLGGTWGLSAMNTPTDQAEPEVPAAPDETMADFTMVQAEPSANDLIDTAAPFADLRRDPMILRLPEATASRMTLLDGPPDFLTDRLGPPAPGNLALLRDDLYVAERQLIATLPSSHEDFAIFQAQREGAMDRSAQDGGAAFLPVSLATNTDAAISNTTSFAVTLRHDQRVPLYRDLIIELQVERKLTDVLQANGLSAEDAAQAARASQQLLGLPESSPTQTVIALRLRPDPIAGDQLLQMSVYGPDGYIASLAQLGPARFARSADPWAGASLLAVIGRNAPSGPPPGSVRLLDAVYSAAIRNGMPAGLVGEMIVILAQLYDLEQIVDVGDRLTVLFAPDQPAQRLDQLIFVGIDGPSGNRPCYVVQTSDNRFACLAPSGAEDSPARPDMLAHGLRIPIRGERIVDFGQTPDPKLGLERTDTAVIWSAPTGAPVVVAADGVVSFVGEAGDKGFVIHIDHDDDMQTRYAYLLPATEPLAKGMPVTAGQEIGTLAPRDGTADVALSFELRLAGKAANPLPNQITGSEAVSSLVARIIQVESAGNATAKNPLSSATGAGQFIESTWLRMIRDYRSDFFATMARQQILDLRKDFALSREMVTNLARENEAFLRARGHQITPGRLYLAHFLGAQGADQALRADPVAPVGMVMGAQVVAANPFLRGKSMGDLVAWSDAKMRSVTGTSRAAAAPAMRALDPDVISLRNSVDAILSAQ